MKKFIKAAVAGALFASPLFAFAATGDGLNGVVKSFGEIINTATPVAVAIALLAFFWGLAMYVMSFSGDDKDKKKGRDMMVYGILVLFVMVSVWGIVQLLQESFKVDSSKKSFAVPCVQKSSGSSATNCP